MRNRLYPDANRLGITRRDFLWMTTFSAAGFVVGCATNPVTGKSQLMLVSEQAEIDLDRQNSPHQFSADYGISQDEKLNAYIGQTGNRLAVLTHRPQMPYSFQAVNAVYINAYAFPGGSIGITRGIILSLENEAELAALLGHELGHVNARHTAARMSKGQLTQAVVAGISVYAGTKGRVWGQITSQLGMLGAGVLLAAYSRENEREADALGMQYMVAAGYGSDGFVGLMDMLKGLSKHNPSTVQLLFSTHPMSTERYQDAVSAAERTYPEAKGGPLYKERYMDHTAGLRRIKGAILAMQQGERSLGEKAYTQAETHFKTALTIAPNDYAGLALMSKCLLVQNRFSEAEKYAQKAKQVYPKEAQAQHLSGYSQIKQNKYDAAYAAFSEYDRLLPGNTNTLFFKGLALTGMQRQEDAAQHFYQYLQKSPQGDQAQYAYQRLVEWGYIKPE